MAQWWIHKDFLNGDMVVVDQLMDKRSFAARDSFKILKIIWRDIEKNILNFFLKEEPQTITKYCFDRKYESVIKII